jgi:hypothetical protein
MNPFRIALAPNSIKPKGEIWPASVRFPGYSLPSRQTRHAAEKSAHRTEKGEGATLKVAENLNVSAIV